MDTFLKELEAKLKESLDFLHGELQGVRSNRPSVGLVEDVRVEAYGQQLTVRELGSLSVRPPRDIEVSVWDPSILNPTAKAIESAKAGFSVSVSGTLIRITLPPLTDERRVELSKLVKKMVEASRITVRGHREDVNKKIRAAEDAGELSEDQAFKGRERVQKSVDAANQRIEAMLEAKIAELAE